MSKNFNEEFLKKHLEDMKKQEEKIIKRMILSLFILAITGIVISII